MRRGFLGLLSVLAFAFWIGPACAASDPAPREFAYGMPLQMESGGAFYGVRLPVDVYRGVTRLDLGDICVFNGQSEIVPFMVRRSDVATAQVEPGIPLHLFPILGAPGASLDGISLRIQKDASGSIINVNTKEGAGSDRGVVAYLVDACMVGRPIRGLDLGWQSEAESYVGKVFVESSDDLESWSPLVRSATIASLHYGDHSLMRRTITFAPSRSKYFRLSWHSGHQPLQLTGISAEPSQEVLEQPREWLNLSPVPSGGTSGEYYFDVHGLMPIDRVRVHLSQKNSVASVSLHSRPSDKDEWRQRRTALIYGVVMEGEQITNPDIVLSPDSDRHWMLRFEGNPSTTGKGAPELEVGWSPQELVFVASGDGPYILAYGSGRAIPGKSQLGTLLGALSGERKDKAIVLPAQTGPQVVLGGELMLRPAPPALPWKQWVLWAVLIVGVVLLAGMAVHLYRQIEKQGKTS